MNWIKRLITLLVLSGAALAQNWTPIPMSANAPQIRNFALYPNGDLIGADRTHGVWKWDGTNWTSLNNGLPNLLAWTVTYDATFKKLELGLAAPSGGSVLYYQSTDEGQTWQKMAFPINLGNIPNYLGSSITSAGFLTMGGFYGPGGSCGSAWSADGVTFQTVSCTMNYPGNPEPGGNWGFYTNPVTKDDWMGTEQFGLLRSTDGGKTYQECTPAEQSIDKVANLKVGNAQGLSNDAQGNMLFTAQGGAWKALTAGQTCPVPASSMINTKVANSSSNGGRIIYTDPFGSSYYGHAVDAKDPDSVYRSTDGGSTWAVWDKGLPQSQEAWEFLYDSIGQRLCADLQDPANNNAGSIWCTPLGSSVQLPSVPTGVGVQVGNVAPPQPPQGGFDGPAELPRVLLNTALSNTPAPGAVVQVPVGGLQIALNNAQCGQRLQLAAGSLQTGTFTFPNKPCDDQHWIRLETAGAITPENTRITPCYAGVASLPGRPFKCSAITQAMATIEEPSGNVTGPLIFADGANHYRLVGIKITRAVGNGIIYSLISSTATSKPADKIILDRVWLAGTAQDETKNGLQLNGFTNTALIDSYSSNMICISKAGSCTDSKVVGGATSTLPGGPYKVTNNFLEASGEDIIFGGGPATTTPTDIEIRHNHFFKPLIWLAGQPGFVGDVNGNPFMVKNLLELKNAQRVLVEGNIFEDSWGGFSQSGYMLLLTPKNQASGCPICQVTDVTVRYNTFSHAGGGIQIANVPDDNGAIGKDGERYSIHDITIDDINKTLYVGNGVLLQIYSAWPSAGQIQHLWFNHITGFPDISGKILAISNDKTFPQMTDLKIENSIFGQALYPVWSTSGGTTDCAIASKPLPVLSTCFNPYVWQQNAMIAVDTKNYPATVWPSNSYFPASASTVQFKNFNNGVGGDYTLQVTSPYAKHGTDGKDMGADIPAIQQAIVGVN